MLELNFSGWLPGKSSEEKGYDIATKLAPKFAGSDPAEAIGFFSDVKKSSVCLPPERK